MTNDNGSFTEEFTFIELLVVIAIIAILDVCMSNGGV